VIRIKAKWTIGLKAAVLALGTVFFLTACATPTQTAVADSAPSNKTDAALRVVTLLGAAEAAVQTIQIQLPYMRTQLIAQGMESDLAEVYVAEFEREFIAFVPEMKQLLAAEFAKTFTYPELVEIGDFLSTPVGRKMVAEQPELMAKGAKIGEQWGLQNGTRILSNASKILQERNSTAE